ncbi:hypothetical protein CBS101457_000244 [Exobasidium rhododendri]|nr:hypothetical protein CBS101457_000244 [Exobasidium rhododendri]
MYGYTLSEYSSMQGTSSPHYGQFGIPEGLDPSLEFSAFSVSDTVPSNLGHYHPHQYQTPDYPSTIGQSSGDVPSSQYGDVASFSFPSSPHVQRGRRSHTSRGDPPLPRAGRSEPQSEGIQSSASATAKVDLGFPYSEEQESSPCWFLLHPLMQDKLFKVVMGHIDHQTRNVVEHLQTRMTPIVAQGLLSQDYELISIALGILFNSDCKDEWKKKLSEEEADLLLYRLQDVSGQKIKYVEFFLNKTGITADFARYLCDASEEERRAFAVEFRLVKEGKGKDRPGGSSGGGSSTTGREWTRTWSVIDPRSSLYHHWMIGTTKPQRSIIVQNVIRLLKCSGTKAHSILNQECVRADQELGLRIYNAVTNGDDAEALRIIREVTVVDVPYDSERL